MTANWPTNNVKSIFDMPIGGQCVKNMEEVLDDHDIKLSKIVDFFLIDH